MLGIVALGIVIRLYRKHNESQATEQTRNFRRLEEAHVLDTVSYSVTTACGDNEASHLSLASSRNPSTAFLIRANKSDDDEVPVHNNRVRTSQSHNAPERQQRAIYSYELVAEAAAQENDQSVQGNESLPPAAPVVAPVIQHDPGAEGVANLGQPNNAPMPADQAAPNNQGQLNMANHNLPPANPQQQHVPNNAGPDCQWHGSIQPRSYDSGFDDPNKFRV